MDLASLVTFLILILLHTVSKTNIYCLPHLLTYSLEGYHTLLTKVASRCVSQCPTVGPKDPNVHKEYKINLYACKSTPQ